VNVTIPTESGDVETARGAPRAIAASPIAGIRPARSGDIMAGGTGTPVRGRAGGIRAVGVLTFDPANPIGWRGGRPAEFWISSAMRC
jgi:hypothetical protein